MAVVTAKREIITPSRAQSIDEHVLRISTGRFPSSLLTGNPYVGMADDDFAIDPRTGVVVYRIEEPEHWIATGEFQRGAHIYFFNFIETEPVTESTASSEIIPEEILDRLEYLAGLQENWDSGGATGVSEVTIDKVKDLLRRAYSAAGVRVPIPFISPAHDGMLVLEWKISTGKELILDVPPDETPPGFLLVEPSPSGDEFETDAEIGEEWPIERVIRQMLAS